MMYGTTLDLMEARTLHEEHERRVQQYLLEREFARAQAVRRTALPWRGALQQLWNAIRWLANGTRIRSAVRQNLGEV